MKFKSTLTVLFSILAMSASAYAVDYPANHCEIFVDKVDATVSSHAAHNVYLYLKTLNDRLDSPIAEVGFYARSLSYNYRGDKQDQGWSKLPVRSFVGSKNYYVLELNLSSDFGADDYEGAVFVRTQKGTTFWLKAGDGKNFTFNQSTWNWIGKKRAYGPAYYTTPETAFSTQHSDFTSYFNPGNCY